jgi:NADH pyrophosphatase NudC (nudix superfamily)
MTILSIGALGGTTFLGFCAGLFAFKVKSRWCPRCGVPTLPQQPIHQESKR